MTGWFGVLLAAACVMVGLVAVYLGGTSADADQPEPDNLMIPIAMLFLRPIAFATMAAGAVGLFWPAFVDPKGHNLRCWIALLMGAGAAAASFMFGPNF